MSEPKNFQIQADAKSIDNESENEKVVATSSEAIRKFASSRPEAMMEMMSMNMEMGPLGNPLYNKMTPEHITKVLDLAVQHDERQYELHKSSQDNEHSESFSIRRYWFASFIVVVLLTCFICYFFQEKPSVLVPTLTGLIGLISGFVGGWGLGKNQKK